MGRATLSLTVLLVLGTVAAGVAPPTPATAHPPTFWSLLEDPDDPRGWESGRPALGVHDEASLSPHSPWLDHLGRWVYRLILKPAIKILLWL